MMAKLEGVKTLDMVNGEITKVAYGGAAYERVEGGAKVGDMVLVKEAWGDQNVGEFFVVTYTKPGIIDQIVGMDGNTCEASSYKHRLKIFRKVAAATNPSVEDRVAKAEGEIESLKSDVAALKGEAEYKRIAKSEARAGDYVKFDDPPSYLTDKEYYEIKEFDDGDPVIIDDDNDEYDTYIDNFEVYRKVNAASVEAKPKPERLKVGDYAKVVGGESDSAEINDIVQVMVDDDSTLPFRCDDLSGKSVGWFYEGELVRATDEEVAEAKRVAAEAAEHKKWAEIGREVGEYKKGDIARVVDNQCAGHVSNGDIIEVLRQDSSGSVLDTVHEYYLRVELITPVEARFDR
ncbi:hypothetical protein [Bacillus halotolerans]|uniref:hypothetical protein n=1 Tax=Bacillus halotolerans TaxID=260554 RepID=UPI003F6D18EA